MKSLKEHQQEREKRRESAEQRRTASLDYVMNDARGRDFVWWLLQISGPESQSLSLEEQIDMSYCAFLEGRRSIGLTLLDRLKEPRHFEQYITLLREKQNDE